MRFVKREISHSSNRGNDIGFVGATLPLAANQWSAVWPFRELLLQGSSQDADVAGGPLSERVPARRARTAKFLFLRCESGMSGGFLLLLSGR